jgi:predicted methyltransferase
MGSIRSLVLGFLLSMAGVAAVGAAASGSLSEALASESRPAEDRARDAGRKPAEVIAFLGIEPGMRVIDLVAASGWYTEVLSLAVGPEGVVYAQNPEVALKIRDGANDKALTARLLGGRLPNVERLDLPLAEVTIEPGSLDAALTALNFHDIYNGGSPEAADAFLKRVNELLKPGGVLGLIDHAGAAGENDQELHRIQESLVVAAAKAAGFVVEAESDLLRNPQDDRSKSVFDPEIRGRTDRFLFRLRKPR